MSSPVKPVTPGAAMKITLDHYYDILKARAGNIANKQFIQLSLASSVLDLAPEPTVLKPSDGGYHWHSKYNMLQRCDRSIEIAEIDGELAAQLVPFSTYYGEFLDLLGQYAVKVELSPSDQARYAQIQLQLRDHKRTLRLFSSTDRSDWLQYAAQWQIEPGDYDAWARWSKDQGYFYEMRDERDAMIDLLAERKSILNRQWGDPADQTIAEAVVQFDRSTMGYPIHPDNLYADGDRFDPTFLSTAITQSDSQFEIRPVVGFSMTFENLIKSEAGAFSVTMDRTTSQSTSISTDWSAGASASYAFVRVSASASEHTSIQRDFNNTESVSVAANAVVPVDLNFPWVNHALFNNKRVKENIRDFADFFGPRGKLRYYPIRVITLRGMEAKFKSSQAYSFDYERKFSARGGGGFSAFGISFGGSASYSKNVKKHEVDQAGTELTFTDGNGTIRFAGFVVQQNTVWEDSMGAAAAASGAT